jgi:hypothetical protein
MIYFFLYYALVVIQLVSIMTEAAWNDIRGSDILGTLNYCALMRRTLMLPLRRKTVHPQP